jgi:hypothetical protein
MPSQEVCAANTVTRYFGYKACVSSCTFFPEVEPKMTICAIEDYVDLANVKPGANNVKGDFGTLYTWYSVMHTSLLFRMRACQPLILIDDVGRLNTGVIAVATIFSQ